MLVLIPANTLAYRRHQRSGAACASELSDGSEECNPKSNHEREPMQKGYEEVAGVLEIARVRGRGVNPSLFEVSAEVGERLLTWWAVASTPEFRPARARKAPEAILQEAGANGPEATDGAPGRWRRLTVDGLLSALRERPFGHPYQGGLDLKARARPGVRGPTPFSLAKFGSPHR